jgi:FemAB-related protein (PEP-CTERM system-associated)
LTGVVAIREEPPGDEWDAFVRTAEGASFCHLSGWARIMSGAMGHRVRGIVARDGNDEIVGVLPLVEMRSLLFGHHLVSVPFLNYGGPLGSGEARREMVRHAISTAAGLGAATLQLRSRSAHLGLEEDDLGLRTDREKVTVLLDLPSDSEELWSSFKGKVRSQVRRPTKDGMEARLGPDQRDAFYRVFAHNMRDLGTPVLPRALFDQIADTFPDRTIFAAVYSDGVPVAGSCGFCFGEEYEMTWASSLREFNRSAPNMLLYWACMEEAIRRGLRVFNFGRCTPGEGTHRFKLQWGGYDEPLHWRRWTPVPPEADDAESKGGLFERAIGVWQRLPVPLANRLGPIVSKRIPWF